MNGLRPNKFFLDRVLSVRLPHEILISFGTLDVTQRDLVSRALIEDRYALSGRNVLIATEETLPCALALLELDGVANRIVICPHGIPTEHMAEICKTAEIDVIVSDKKSVHVKGIANLDVAKTLYHSRDFARDKTIVPIETEWVLLTSGTTGVPKMVRHTFETLTVNIRKPISTGKTIKWASFNDMRRFSGLQMFLHALLTDSTLLLKPVAMTVNEFLPVLAESSATHVSGTPTHWRKVLMFEDRHKLALEQITLVGEIADQPILDALKACFPKARITHIYGSTESGTGFSVHDIKAGFPADYVGKELKGLEIRVDKSMLSIRSNRSAHDYVGTSTVDLQDSDGFVETGDEVELRGDRYYFLGRRNGAVNIGGSRVHPEEVEALLNAEPSVAMSVVSAKKNPFTGSILVADVVLSNYMSTTETERTELAAKLMASLRSKLEPYKVPARIRFVSELHLSAAGKLDRRSA
jgi:acyl-coenzyme A synthetase/AMP-(fatty) acid ligase